MRLGIAWRLARRELRGGLEGFRLFVGCLFLGVFAIAAVGSVAHSLLAGLRADARVLLGGDVEIQIRHRLPTTPQLEYLDQRATISKVAEIRAMVGPTDRDARILAELKAVDAAYPLYGSIALEGDGAQSTTSTRTDGALQGRLRSVGGALGAIVDPSVLARLNLKVGDPIQVGDARFEIRGVIAREPDRRLRGFELGPRVMISEAALPKTALILPGSMVNYRYRAALPDRLQPEIWAEEVRAAFPAAGWTVRTFRQSSPGFRRFIDRLSHFLSLVGLTALLIGGVGVSNAVRGYLDTKMMTVATMKCLGASSATVLWVYLLQIAVLACIGVGLGVIAGALAPWGTTLAADLLPVSVRAGVYPKPLAVAAAFGLLTALIFTLWPLSKVRDVKPQDLFRSRVVTPPGRPTASILAITSIAAAAVAGLALWESAYPQLTLGFIAGVGVSFFAFAMSARAVVGVARRIRNVRHPEARLVLANLHRPGASTTSIILSMGLGFTVLAAIALVEGNLAHQLQNDLPKKAPSYVFIDIQNDQVEAFERAVLGIAGVHRLERVPTLRGRITKIGGVQTEDVDIAPQSRWAVDSDRFLTYAANPPEDAEIVAGQWWPSDHTGEPRVSLDASLAEGFGVGVGDTLTFNILGREVTATITSLRKINWRSMGINFASIISPGVLEAAPHTHIATAYTSPEAEDEVFRTVTGTFANISAVRIREAVEEAKKLVASIASVVRIAALLTLISGVFVLAGGMLATHQRRVYEGVILKVLGATRRRVTRMLLLEYGILSAVTSLIASFVGALASWAVMTRIMQLDWIFLPKALATTIAACAAVTLSVGAIGTWRALSQKAAPLLRNE